MTPVPIWSGEYSFMNETVYGKLLSDKSKQIASNALPGLIQIERVYAQMMIGQLISFIQVNINGRVEEDTGTVAVAGV